MAMPLKGHRPPVTLFDKNTVAIDSIIVAGVNRLEVNASLGGIAPANDIDDDSVAAGQTTLLVIAENYGYNGSGWRRLRTGLLSAVMNEGVQGLVCASFAYGTDFSRAAGNRGVNVEARVVGTTPLDERYFGLYANAFVRAINSTAAAGSKGVAVDGQQGDVYTSTMIGLMCNARLGSYDAIGAAAARLVAIAAASVAGTESEKAAGLAVYEARRDGFAASRRGKRFVMTGQSPGTLITGGTAFGATAPALMLRINSASYRAVIRSLVLSIGNTPGGPVYVTVAIDTSDRYTSGGGAVTPLNMNEESSTATGVLAYDNSVAIVAAAAGGGTRYVANLIMPARAEANAEIDFGDGLLLGPTAASLLVYVWAATTAPQFTYNIEFEDVT